MVSGVFLCHNEHWGHCPHSLLCPNHPVRGPALGNEFLRGAAFPYTASASLSLYPFVIWSHKICCSTSTPFCSWACGKIRKISYIPWKLEDSTSLAVDWLHHQVSQGWSRGRCYSFARGLGASACRRHRICRGKSQRSQKPAQCPDSPQLFVSKGVEIESVLFMIQALDRSKRTCHRNHSVISNLRFANRYICICTQVCNVCPHIFRHT